MARAVEDAGYDSLWVSDHIVVPVGESYIPAHMTEPLAVLSFLAAATGHVTLGTSVLVVPYRDPVFTAKHLASVDVLCGGRLVAGVGVGWLAGEFAALGLDHRDRGRVTDEWLRIIRNLWETDPSTYEGPLRSYRDVVLRPKASDARRGTIPLVVGGNSPAAVRRAALLGDGWHPINLSPAEAATGVARYREACAAAGRDPGPVIVRIMPGGRTTPAGERWPLTGTDAEITADVEAYAEAGVDELLVSWWAPDVPTLISRWRGFLRAATRAAA